MPLQPENLESLYGPEDNASFYASWKKSFIESVLISDIGKKRRNNEDSCTIFCPKDKRLLESRGMLFAVADGMGGASAGEYASRMALEYTSSNYFDGASSLSIPDALRLAVEHANEFIFDESESKTEYAGMGTTLSAMIIHGSWAYIAQVGDSRVYLLREGEGLRQITEDHSLVAEQVRSGLLDETEAQNHSLRNLITRAVGIKEDIEVDLFALGLKKHDVLLLCSDGLSNMVPAEQIKDCLENNDTEEASRRMLQYALEAGGQDNITLITARIVGEPPPSKYQHGAKMSSSSKSGIIYRLMHSLRH